MNQTFKSLWLSARTRLLRCQNRRRIRDVSAQLQTTKRLPVFVIASPPDLHLAPLAVLNSPPGIFHVVMANGVSLADVVWLRGQIPGIPVVNLKASLQANYQTFLSHAEIVRLCSSIAPGDFAIQDSDCFVLDSKWWECLRIDDCGAHYAAGPFAKPLHRLGVSMPDTFLVLLHGKSYRARELRGIRPDIANSPVPVLAKMLSDRSFVSDYFPDEGKTYYDTLQMHWTAATLEGVSFLELPGADEVVVHVGGSSYLNDLQTDDLCHWDYWPLNTPYFHMRVLESPRFERFRPRFEKLFEKFGSAAKLLEDHPDFLKSNRYSQSERMIAHFRAFMGDLT
jgi:hypothetical protein